MIIIEVKKNNIEQALKQYKFKVYKTKQLEFLMIFSIDSKPRMSSVD